MEDAGADVKLSFSELKRFIEAGQSTISADSFIAKVKLSLKKAREAGFDVAEYESALPILERQARYAHAAKQLDELGKYLNSEIYSFLTPKSLLLYAADAIRDAEKAGVDISQLKQRFLELEKSAKLKMAEEQMEELYKMVCGEKSAYESVNAAMIYAQEALKEAEESGNDISTLKNKFHCLEKKLQSKA